MRILLSNDDGVAIPQSVVVGTHEGHQPLLHPPAVAPLQIEEGAGQRLPERRQTG